MTAVVCLVVLGLAANWAWVTLDPFVDCGPPCRGGRVYSDETRWHPHRACGGKGHRHRFRWWRPFASRKVR